MAKYKKRPVIVEAEQFKVEGEPGPGAMFMEWPILFDEAGYFLVIPTLEGPHRANEGDWIITGIKGEKYPCKPDIFEATYERVTD